MRAMAQIVVTERITQYLPAYGWDACYEDEPRRLPLLCWALTGAGDVLGLVFRVDRNEVWVAEDRVVGKFERYERAAVSGLVPL